MSDQIDVVFPDLLGLLHGKTVPTHRIDHPTHYAITVMVQGLDLVFLETDTYSTSAPCETGLVAAASDSRTSIVPMVATCP